MGKINVLNQKVANKIAAGEVIERPLAVVKELVENAVDAGAKAITVEIKKGGIAYIRVTDNGSGISPEDAIIAFERHATSKIRTDEDLDAIATLGFRGEALSSIAAVAQVELITKTVEVNQGMHVIIHGGEVINAKEIGCPHGTTITVKNLFYNTPARMKFLKKDTTEAGHISDIVNRMILGHPEISFRYINNGKEVVFTPGDHKLVNCIYHLYGKEYAKAMLPVAYENQGIHIKGMVGKASIARANRSFQSFFINGRYVKSNVFTYAVQEAYKNMLPINKFPMVVLHLDINPLQIDVNVHPTKMEIKFSQEREVFDAVYWAVKNALHVKKDVPEVALTEKHVFRYSTQTTKDTDTIKQEEDINTQQQIQTPQVQYKPSILPVHTAKQKVEEREIRQAKTDEISPIDEPIHTFRIIGQLFDTYILVEKEDALYLIDQHAAHERLKYEALMKDYRKESLNLQQLLVPVVLQLSDIEMELFKEKENFFKKMGFEMAEFGHNSIVIRQTPIALQENALKDLIIEIIDATQQFEGEPITQIESCVLYKIACKSAIKANKMLHHNEMKHLLDQVFLLGNINTCPHGRPITIALTKYQIEKEFKRVGT